MAKFLLIFALGTILWGQTPLRKPTFAADVAPILYKSCAPCHHDGGIGPFPLTSYDEARRHASQIADVTARGYMPPWPPQQGYGEFKGDRHLTRDQIATIAAWVKAGTPRGNPAEEPARPVFNDEWQMGKPDLILRMPQPFRLPASGPDLFRNFIIPSTVTGTRWVRGFELRLNTKGAVHHANVVLDRTQSLRRRSGPDGQPGFPGMDVVTEAAANEFEPDSHFLFWKPATVLAPEPDDLSWRLDPGTDLILNLHLQPTGKEESVQAEIGLYFGSNPPTKFPMLVQLEHDGALRIPPGDRSFTVTDELVLPVDVDVLAIYPHAHYLGKTIEAWATLPDGKHQSLIRIPDWDINWQATYEYRQPVHLPRGTHVAMRITYDNSDSNPRNPNHPPKLVLNGDRSQDEMGHVWLQVLPKADASGDDPRWALQEAVMRHRLEKYPHDFLAEYNLGAFLQSRNRLDEALEAYRFAIRTQPDSAAAHNSAGGVLLEQGQLPAAIAEFRTALASDAGYLNARYNLARALAFQGDLAAATTEYRIFLKDRPEDSEAQAGLGTVFFRQKNLTEALQHFQIAAHLDPANAQLQANLGTLLAMTGNLPAAVQAFETALRLDPKNEEARRNLGRAQVDLRRRQ